MNAAWKSTEVELIQNRALRQELDRLICSEEKKTRREENKSKWIKELQESLGYGAEELFSVDAGTGWGGLYNDENRLKKIILSNWHY